jgi:hypothetical protein
MAVDPHMVLAVDRIMMATAAKIARDNPEARQELLQSMSLETLERLAALMKGALARGEASKPPTNGG